MNENTKRALDLGLAVGDILLINGGTGWSQGFEWELRLTQIQPEVKGDGLAKKTFGGIWEKNEFENARWDLEGYNVTKIDKPRI